MSDRQIDFDWNQMRAFLATVERGSLSGAARELGLTQPTLSRQIAALEQALGLLLFERMGRRLVLTASGGQLVEQVKIMRAAADRIGLAVSGQSQATEGLVRITASDIVAAHMLPPVLERLRDIAPGIVVEVLASNSIDNLMRREADIAIRHVQPDHPDLIARRCPDSAVLIYAASALLDRLGRPSTAAALGDAPFIGFVQGEALVAELNARGIPVTQQNFRWITNSFVAGIEMVRQGLGIGVMFREVAERIAGLECVLPDMRPIAAPMWLVAHRELHSSRRIRLVFDLLVETLSTERRLGGGTGDPVDD
ncbi:LysR family transcriptional regulator [Devosia sp.]|uniref:LysR family transcriptional regulator n=1 Tax=Devosia sp. TaxID=1871048 RepID=UPI002FC7837A